MGAAISGSEASSPLARAVADALALEPVLRRRPGSVSTCRDAGSALQAVMSAALVDRAPRLPAPLVEGLVRLLSADSAVQAGYAARMMYALTANERELRTDFRDSRMSQVGAARGFAGAHVRGVLQRAGCIYPCSLTSACPTSRPNMPPAPSSPLLPLAT
jgi:hypothetical protein